MFKLFADLIAFHLDAARAGSRRARRSCSDERKTAELREQFIAVLGHDLRNPLAAIDAAARAAAQGAAERRGSAAIVALMQDSVRRMAGLIDNVLDFARGRLGGGLTLNRAAARTCGADARAGDRRAAAHGVPTRIERAHARPEAAGRLAIRAASPSCSRTCSATRLTHGDPTQPGRGDRREPAAAFELSVANARQADPAAALEQLFQPFSRGGRARPASRASASASTSPRRSPAPMAAR